MVASIRWSLRLMIISQVVWLAARPVAAQPGGGRGFGGGGFGGGDPREMQEGFFRRMDRNGNGVIEGDELDAMPSFLRDTMRDTGRDMSRPIDQNEFSELTTKSMERFRSSGGGFGRGGSRPGGLEVRVSDGNDRGAESSNRPGGSFDNRDGSSRPDDRRDSEQRGDGRRSDRSDSSSRGDGNGESKSSSRKSDKPAGFSFGPVTLRLPEQYRSKDRDGDGQIGLYEWSRSDFATFRKLDRDGDGFLTAAELIKAGGGKMPNSAIPSNIVAAVVDSAAAKSSPPSAEGTPAGTPRGAESSVPVNAAGGSSSAAAAPGSNDELTRRAMQTFDALDRDKNGTISAEEWARSRTMRPQFERANANMYPPISREQFVAQFIKVNPGFSR